MIGDLDGGGCTDLLYVEDKHVAVWLRASVREHHALGARGAAKVFVYLLNAPAFRIPTTHELPEVVEPFPSAHVFRITEAESTKIRVRQVAWEAAIEMAALVQGCKNPMVIGRKGYAD